MLLPYLRIFTLTLCCLSILTACSQTKPATSDETTPEEIPLSQITAENRHPLYLSRDLGSSWEPIGPELPKEINVSFLDTLHGEIVMATDNLGLFISEGNMTHWKQIGQALPGSKINSLHIADGIIYAGVYAQGIFVSEDQGNTWYDMNANLEELRIQSICRFKDQLYIGTDSNICRWSAENKAWEVLYEKLQAVSLEPYQNKLVAGTNRGTLLSDNQGRNWRFIHEFGAPHYTHIVAGNIVEMLISGKLYISNNAGFTWFESPFEPNHGTYVYEVVATKSGWLMSNNYGIFRSKDYGISWQHVFKTEAMGFFDFVVMGDVVIGGTRKWDEYRKRD